MDLHPTSHGMALSSRLGMAGAHGHTLVITITA